MPMHQMRVASFIDDAVDIIDPLSIVEMVRLRVAVDKKMQMRLSVQANRVVHYFWYTEQYSPCVALF